MAILLHGLPELEVEYEIRQILELPVVHLVLKQRVLPLPIRRQIPNVVPIKDIYVLVEKLILFEVE